MLIVKTCARCGQPFEAPRSSMKFCGSPCRQAAYRDRVASAASGVAGVTSVDVTNGVVPEVDPVVPSIVLPPQLALASLEDCKNELVTLYRQARMGKRDAMDVLRLSQIVQQVIAMFEAKQKFELENKPIEGFCVTEINIQSVPPGWQVVKPEHSDLIQAIARMEPAVWKLLGREPPKPRLVSDVMDDTGQMLDPRTLEPLSSA